MNKRIETTYGGKRCYECPHLVNDSLKSTCAMVSVGLLDRWQDCPDEQTPIQIEISPADSPTREELIEALTDYVEEHRHQGLCYGLDKGVRDQAESLLSRCEEADHDNR